MKKNIHPFGGLTLLLTFMIVFSFSLQAQDFLGYILGDISSRPRKLTVNAFYHEDNPDLADEFYMKAMLEDSMGHPEQAILYLDSSLLYAPGDCYAYTNRARLCWSTEQYFQALKDIRAAENLDCPAEYYPLSAWIRMFSGDTAGLYADLKSTRMMFPDDETTLIMNTFYAFMHHDSSCMTEVARLIRKKDTVTYRFMEISLSWYATDVETHTDLLIRKCDTLISMSREQDTLYAYALLMKSLLCGIKGQEEEVQGLMEEIGRMQALHPELCIMVGNYYMSRSDFDKARKMASRARADSMYYLQGSLLLIEIETEAENLDLARSMIDSLMPDYPDQAELYYLRARISSLKGDMDAALKDFAIGLNLSGLDEFGEVEQKTRSSYSRMSEQMEEIEDLISSEPDNAGYRARRGELLIVQHDYEEAIEDFNFAIEKQPSNGYLYLKRGTAFYSIGQYERACQDFRKARDLGEFSAGQIIRESCNGY